MSDAYAKAGVNIDAGNEAVAQYRELLAGARRDPRVLEGIGGFGGCFALRGYHDPVLVGSTDGVGTKVLVASALGRFDTIGRDLVHHCINDIACANAQPLFFLDYYAVGTLQPDVAAAVVSGVAAACSQYGVALLGGETAEMPGVYAPHHFDLAGTIVGALERRDMVDITLVTGGDAIVGLPANGFHTNGYSLVRSILPAERWSARVDASSQTIGEALLAVHPCYLPYVQAVRDAGIRIKAMAHITGGGLLENVPRVLPDGLAARFDRSRWQVPPVMSFVVREAKLRDEEAYRTFNMGIGFCIIVAADDDAAALDAVRAAMKTDRIAGAAGEPAIIGAIEPRHPCGPAAIVG